MTNRQRALERTQEAKQYRKQNPCKCGKPSITLRLEGGVGGLSRYYLKGSDAEFRRRMQTAIPLCRSCSTKTSTFGMGMPGDTENGSRT